MNRKSFGSTLAVTMFNPEMRNKSSAAVLTEQELQNALNSSLEHGNDHAKPDEKRVREAVQILVQLVAQNLLSEWDVAKANKIIEATRGEHPDWEKLAQEIELMAGVFYPKPMEFPPKEKK